MRLADTQSCIIVGKWALMPKLPTCLFQIQINTGQSIISIILAGITGRIR